MRKVKGPTAWWYETIETSMLRGKQRFLTKRDHQGNMWVKAAWGVKQSIQEPEEAIIVEAESEEPQ